MINVRHPGLSQATALTRQGRLSEAEQNLRRVLARVKTPRRYVSAALRLAYLELPYRHAPNTAAATVNAALTKYPLDRMEDELVDRTRVAKAHLGLGPVDIDVHAPRIDLEEERVGGLAVAMQDA